MIIMRFSVLISILLAVGNQGATGMQKDFDDMLIFCIIIIFIYLHV